MPFTGHAGTMHARTNTISGLTWPVTPVIKKACTASGSLCTRHDNRNKSIKIIIVAIEATSSCGDKASSMDKQEKTEVEKSSDS